MIFVALADYSYAETYLDSLKERGQVLARSPQWLSLTHFHQSWYGWEGLADSESFYLSDTRDPLSELHATLEAFFSTQAHDPEDPHPQCRFIARYEWLKKRLQFDSAQLPEIFCSDFETWWQALNPQSVSLIFPGTYLNNPASMFGHTLLRIDAEGGEPTLLSYAVNYGAVDTDPPGVLYAFKGISGLYQGLFSVGPYYDTVAKYSDIENRDIWEMELAFTKEELRMLLLHLWELRSVYFDYFFFTENCSYLVLALLEAARPELALLQEFKLWTIPSETVREIVSRPELVRSTRFRPARNTLIAYRLEQMSPQARELARELQEGKIPESLSDLDSKSQARVLESAYDMLEFRRLAGDSVDENYALDLLKRRSALPYSAEFLPMEEPPFRPQDGHPPLRISLGGGFDDGKLFGELGIRPAYHELIDPPWGFQDGYQIALMDTSVRITEGDSIEIQRVAPLSIRSYSRRDEFSKPLSWDFELLFDRRNFDKELRRVSSADLGVGISHKLHRRTLSYVLAAHEVSYGSAFDGDFVFSAGPRLGALIQLAEDLSAQLDSTVMVPYWGESRSRVELLIQMRYSLDSEKSINLSFSGIREYGSSYLSPSLAYWHYY